MADAHHLGNAFATILWLSNAKPLSLIDLHRFPVWPIKATVTWLVLAYLLISSTQPMSLINVNRFTIWPINLKLKDCSWLRPLNAGIPVFSCRYVCGSIWCRSERELTVWNIWLYELLPGNQSCFAFVGFIALSGSVFFSVYVCVIKSAYQIWG